MLIAVDEADEGVRLLLLTVGVRDRDRDRWSLRLLPSLAALKLDGVALRLLLRLLAPTLLLRLLRSPEDEPDRKLRSALRERPRWAGALPPARLPSPSLSSAMSSSLSRPPPAASRASPRAE